MLSSTKNHIVRIFHMIATGCIINQIWLQTPFLIKLNLVRILLRINLQENMKLQGHQIIPKYFVERKSGKLATMHYKFDLIVYIPRLYEVQHRESHVCFWIHFRRKWFWNVVKFSYKIPQSTYKGYSLKLLHRIIFKTEINSLS